MFKDADRTAAPGYQPTWSGQADSPHSSDQKPYLNGQLGRSSVSESKPRIVKILLVPVKMVAICVTVPICAALECLSGISIGIILGSGLIMKAYDKHGLVFAMPISIIVYPMGLVMGVGFALVGFFFGIYDGFHLGWNCDKSPLENRAKDVKSRLDAFLKKDHEPNHKETTRYRPIELNDDDSSHSSNSPDVFAGLVKTEVTSAPNGGRLSIKSGDTGATAASTNMSDVSSGPTAPAPNGKSDPSSNRAQQRPYGPNPFDVGNKDSPDYHLT
ncbi:hypothetical protein [Kistimonas asteriae]|uniref:hypothetical protein n=1 Tax=Kistimonas asteriae TaxID=517724 RepID=UPI001BAD0F51|nr:hypothetical protein [Kistimonas asteriae]